MPDLVAAASDDMLRAVGYYGPAGPAPAALARFSAGLDEAIVRVITARPGLDPVVQAMAAPDADAHQTEERRGRGARAWLAPAPAALNRTGRPGFLASTA